MSGSAVFVFDFTFNRQEPSHPAHKTIQHLLLSGLVEIDGEFVAVDCRDVAVAEFLVKDTVAEFERGGVCGDGFGDELAFYGSALHRAAACAIASMPTTAGSS